MLINVLLFLLVNISYVSKFVPGEILRTELIARSVLRCTKGRNPRISSRPSNLVL
jgi:hypothetical protein